MCFSNRVSTLKRKASQLSSLCEVSVCLIGFMPDNTVFTWPDRHADAISTLHYYKQTVANKTMQNKKMKAMDQDHGHQHTNVNGCGSSSSSSSSSSSCSSIMNCTQRDELVRLSNYLDRRLETIRALEENERIRASFQQQQTQSLPQFGGSEAIDFQHSESGSVGEADYAYEFEDLIAATTQPYWPELDDDLFIVPCDFITCYADHDDATSIDLDSILFY